MKIGIRKINLKNRIKSRTTAKLKRKAKRTFIPWYGKKGMGWINDPHKALYNKIYNKTTISVEETVNLFTKGDSMDFRSFHEFYLNLDRENKKEFKHVFIKLRKEHNKQQWEEIKETFRDVKKACKETLTTIEANKPNKYYKNCIAYKFLGVTFLGIILSVICPVRIGIIFFLAMPIYLIIILIKFHKINKKYKR